MIITSSHNDQLFCQYFFSISTLSSHSQLIPSSWASNPMNIFSLQSLLVMQAAIPPRRSNPACLRLRDFYLLVRCYFYFSLVYNLWDLLYLKVKYLFQFYGYLSFLVFLEFDCFIQNLISLLSPYLSKLPYSSQALFSIPFTSVLFPLSLIDHLPHHDLHPKYHPPFSRPNFPVQFTASSTPFPIF